MRQLHVLYERPGDEPYVQPRLVGVFTTAAKATAAEAQMAQDFQAWSDTDTRPEWFIETIVADKFVRFYDVKKDVKPAPVERIY